MRLSQEKGAASTKNWRILAKSLFNWRERKGLTGIVPKAGEVGVRTSPRTTSEE